MTNARLFHFLGWVGALMAFQAAEPGVPVLWVLVGALVTGVIMAMIALFSPMITNRALMQVQRDVSLDRQNRIEALVAENEKLRTAVDELQIRQLELRRIADELEFNLEKANERMREMEMDDAHDPDY